MLLLLSLMRAHYIHVAARTGRLEAGTEEAPFRSSARIELHGHRSTPPYPNSGLGSKFLAVFGTLSLVGGFHIKYMFASLTAVCSLTENF